MKYHLYQFVDLHIGVVQTSSMFQTLSWLENIETKTIYFRAEKRFNSKQEVLDFWEQYKAKWIEAYSEFCELPVVTVLEILE